MEIRGAILTQKYTLTSFSTNEMEAISRIVHVIHVIIACLITVTTGYMPADGDYKLATASPASLCSSQAKLQQKVSATWPGLSC